MSTEAVPVGKRHGRPFTPLFLSIVLLGLADSLVGSYYVLFLAEEANLSATKIGLLFSLPAIGGIAFSFWVGHRFDLRPTQMWAVLALISSVVGYALLTVTTSFAWLLLISMTLLATYQAIYPQLFSMAPVALGNGPVGRRAIPLLRSTWSLAWAIGPVVGAVLVPWFGFVGVLWVTVVILAICVITTVRVPMPRRTRPQGEGGGGRVSGKRIYPRRRVVLLTGSILLFFLAMFAGSIALPLYVTRELELPATIVGWLFSVCAFVEIAVALAVAALPQRVNQRALIVVGILALGLHFAITVVSEGTTMLLIAQLPRGVAIAVLSAAGLRFFQETLAPATGFATTLFSAATDAGFLFSGVLGGVAVDTLGSRATLLACGALTACAAALFIGARATTGRALDR